MRPSYAVEGEGGRRGGELEKRDGDLKTEREGKKKGRGTAKAKQQADDPWNYVIYLYIRYFHLLFSRLTELALQHIDRLSYCSYGIAFVL